MPTGREGKDTVHASTTNVYSFLYMCPICYYINTPEYTNRLGFYNVHALPHQQLCYTLPFAHVQNTLHYLVPHAPKNFTPLPSPRDVHTPIYVKITNLDGVLSCVPMTNRSAAVSWEIGRRRSSSESGRSCNVREGIVLYPPYFKICKATNFHEVYPLTTQILVVSGKGHQW